MTVTCQFGNAVISVGPKSLPSDYDKIFPNFRLDSGSYNAYPFDKYSAEATAWCYYDATAINSLVNDKNNDNDNDKIIMIIILIIMIII